MLPQQTIRDDHPVNTVVYNAVGAVVYSSDKVFENNRTALDLSSMVPRVYNLVLRGSDGGGYTLQFVKR